MKLYYGDVLCVNYVSDMFNMYVDYEAKPNLVFSILCVDSLGVAQFRTSVKTTHTSLYPAFPEFRLEMN